MTSLAKQRGTNFFLKTLSSYLVNLWSSRRSVGRAAKRWQEFPLQGLLQARQGNGSAGSTLVLAGTRPHISSFSLPALHLVALSRLVLVTTVSESVITLRKYPLFAALVFSHFLARWPSWEWGALKAEVGQGLWWDTQPGAGGWNPGQGQFSVPWLIKPYFKLGFLSHLKNKTKTKPNPFPKTKPYNFPFLLCKSAFQCYLMILFSWFFYEINSINTRYICIIFLCITTNTQAYWRKSCTQLLQAKLWGNLRNIPMKMRVFIWLIWESESDAPKCWHFLASEQLLEQMRSYFWF